MRVFNLSVMLFSFLFIQKAYSETITIQDCDDITLGNSAYANDGWIEKYERPDSDTLIIDQWRC